MPKTESSTIYLKDYRPSPYLIETADLHFDLDPKITTVRSKLTVHRSKQMASDTSPLTLQGRKLELRSVKLDGVTLANDQFDVTEQNLTIAKVPQSFELEIETRIRPADNTSLMGLYTSNGIFCTQCEAEGFRKITYFLDRPDTLARYTTTISGDKDLQPILLSNGNLVDRGESGSNRHWAKWHDPFPKPSYLFALVAGELTCVEDRFVTRSGRVVPLRIYVEQHNADKCDHAVSSLKRAMRWDEEVYGREYDLDVFMIVAVDDFNMGAMENKGLNIFNSKYVLAKPETATDTDYRNIEGVIAHEYFHNWSGNRVTCRDWFQLSLKEGFTVFRDQQFSADMNSAAVERIEDVDVLRTYQFREDGSPMAHPVRPDSYQEINNFYTLTVYNKGAELVRMLYHLLGPEGYRKGTDLYFDRHDGQAVTTDDFVRALEDANDVDLTQFRLWYIQAGTPELRVSARHDANRETYTLTVKQSCPATPGQPEKKPFHIPLAMGLIGPDGEAVALRLEGENNWTQGTRILEVRESEHTFTFAEVSEPPVPSLLRDFSAPVKVYIQRDIADLCHLMAHDNNDFNRWDASQQLAAKLMLALVEDFQKGRDLSLNPMFIQAFTQILQDDDLDPALMAQTLTLPAENYIAESMTVIDPVALHKVRQFTRRTLATEIGDIFMHKYQRLTDTGEYTITAKAMGRRALRNVCLGYLIELENREVSDLCFEQFDNGRSMTDVVAALTCLVNSNDPRRDRALSMFYSKWRHENLVLDKWFGIQARSHRAGTLEVVKTLTKHPDFNIKNPNRVRSLIGAFAMGNPVQFHQSDGTGYGFVADQIIRLDPLNPQVAARLVSAYSHWRRYDDDRKALMRNELQRILDTDKLSKDVTEIASKSLV
ncbi:MAG: aminopeptidase N [Gammaproteobacteria bacterium]|nr:aminopeptidase N [Gammaproteobacteria bacterium]